MANRSLVGRLLAKKIPISVDVAILIYFVAGTCIVVAGSYIHWVAACIAAAVVLYDFVMFMRQVRTAAVNDESSRGRELQAVKDVKRRCEEECKKNGNDRGVLWGTMRIPSKDATNHFCVVGAVGSGKTLTLRMLMRDQLPLLKRQSDRRAVIYDPKQDMVPIVKSILHDAKVDCPILILNPFDKRGAGWNIAQDVRTPAAARQLADTLVPSNDKESQPFFSNAVRELLAAVVTVFVTTRPDAWTLRDVLLVMRSQDLLRAVLESFPYTRHIAANFLDAGEVTVGSILATVATKLGPFEPIAAAWMHAPEQLSIAKWLSGTEILILGNDERMRSILDTVNQLFVSLAAQHVLTQPESDKRRTWFFFDEFSEAGKLRGLESIILRGRSKGCCVVLGFQDISHVHSVYEKELGNTIVGQCGNKAFLRIESPETADWASRSFGDLERPEINQSVTRSKDGVTKTFAEQRQLRASVLASQFMTLPTCGPQNGLEGYYLLRSFGGYQASYAWDQVMKQVGPVHNVKALDEAPKEWQYLAAWSDGDAARLNIHRANQNGQANQQKATSEATLDEIDRIEL